MKNIHLFASVVCLMLLASSLFSCTEKEEIGEYDNWQARNAAFVDSIAKVCDKNADGKWVKFCAYNLDSKFEGQSPDNTHYIYVQKLEQGTGTYHPLYNDSVRVHYLGRLIPSASYPQGKVFDKSYASYTFNELTDVPTLFSPSGLTTGFATAVMNMTEGDHWRVFIPYYLGYGSSGQGEILGYSTLVFEMKLAKVYRYQIDTDTRWY